MNHIMRYREVEVVSKKSKISEAFEVDSVSVSQNDHRECHTFLSYPSL